MSKRAKPTPGPWVAAYHETARVWYLDAVGHPFQCALRPTSDFASHAEMDANARLIAAAPELLAACRAALKSCNLKLKAKLHACIAKAEGRPS